MADVVVQIYRSKKKDGAYIYTRMQDGMKEIPEALQKQLAPLEASIVIKLNAERKLAQADAEKVLKSLEEHGYYLQLPPPADAYMQNIENSKLTSRPL